jgi:hypothetical protein
MLGETIQRLDSRFEELIAAYKKLKAAHSILIVERDSLLQERHFMRAELDRILARFAKLDEESS